MMAVSSLYKAIACLLLLFSAVQAQTIFPSNGTEIGTDATTPRLWVNATTLVKFPSLRISPLGMYANLPRGDFLGVFLEGRIVNIDANNANSVRHQDFAFISCDPDPNSALSPSDTLRIVANLQRGNSVILWSKQGNHCGINNPLSLAPVAGLFTTMDPNVAALVANLNFTEASNAAATIRPDATSYTNGTNNHIWGSTGTGSGYSPSPTTAIAMIILYSITGIITALFVVIIISGAVRAHRHPERYGPRNVAGRGRQSRAKGIARAMLETLPIVKFGDHADLPKKNAVGDVEMNTMESAPKDVSKDGTVVKTEAAVTAGSVTTETSTDTPPSSSNLVTPANADGTDDTGGLGCSICTEDFQKGEEVRVLPCNHKFHPICVDPWLLNVSGTCPLCRIDLMPKGPNGEPLTSSSRRGSAAFADEESNETPPLGGVAGSGTASNQTGTIQGLRSALSGSREERIAALRRFRHERQRNSTIQGTQGEDEQPQSGLARRFRERFRIRTRRHEGTDVSGSGDAVPTSPTASGAR